MSLVERSHRLLQVPLVLASSHTWLLAHRRFSRNYLIMPDLAPLALQQFSQGTIFD